MPRAIRHICVVTEKALRKLNIQNGMILRGYMLRKEKMYEQQNC